MNVIARHVGLLLVAMLLACSGGTEQPAYAAGSDVRSLNAARQITVIHVNDSHSTLDSDGPKDANLDGTLGGLTRAATVIQRIRRGTPNALFLHAGDAFEGDLAFPATAGVLELQLLRQLGLDAMTLGNHEFDYGPDVLAASLAAAELQGVAVLSANLTGPSDHPLSSFVTGHVVKEVGGVRVGIFGLTVTDPLERPGPFTLGNTDTIGNLAPLVAAEVAALRSPPASADVVILLSHLSAVRDHEIAAIPENGIDFIIGGHDEFDETFSEYVPDTTMVVRAGHFYQRVGKLHIVVRDQRVQQASHQLIAIDDTVERNPAVTAAVQQLKQGINGSLGFDAFNTPVAYAAQDLEVQWNESMGPRRDLALGDLAADALKAKFGADIGLTTSGFLNDRIYQGPVVANDLFRALPYGINPKELDPSAPDAILPDPVLRVSMTGEQIYDGVEVGLELGEGPQVSNGFLVCYDDSARPRVQFIAIDGVPIFPDATPYSVATNIVVVGALNEAFPRLPEQGVPDPGPIEIPGDFDPLVSQFSTLLEYASGKSLSTPEQPRVLNTTGCMDLLAQ